MIHLPRKSVFLALATVIVLGLGYVAWRQPAPSTLTDIPAATEPEEQGAAPLHPLEIEALRQRSYPGGTITIEREVSRNASFTTQVISFPSDGLKIYALAHVPVAPGPHPMLIFNHGYINPESYQTVGADYRYWLEGIARAGYLVIKPDFRGHGQSEGSPEGGHYSPVYTYDALNLMASLKTYPAANPERVCMAGHSMGAHLTLRAIVASKDIKCSIMLAGVVGSAEDLLYNWTRRGPNTWRPPSGVPPIRQQLLERYGEPKDNPEFWRKVSAINYVDFVAGPVQLHHGTDDESVPKLFSDHLNDALIRAGKPVEYFVYEGGDHQFTGGRSQLALERMVGFLTINSKH